MLALVVVVTIEVAGSNPAPTNPARGRDATVFGTLVYLVRPEHGTASLWLVDLSSGGSRRGPVVPGTTVELVDASAADAGWVGVEHITRRGRLGISVLKGVGAGAEVVALGRGDLVAWGPGGRSLVIARNGSRSGRCAPVRMSLMTVLTQHVEWALHDPGFCGPVTSLSRSAAATYFSAPSGDRQGVYLTGQVGGPHLLFEGYSLVSGSPVSAFVLERTDQHGLSLVDEPDAMLGWNGIGGPISLGSGETTLVVRRVLAWSRDGAQVALIGAVGSTSGVFVVDAGSGSEPREPVHVDLHERVRDASFDADGSLLLSAADGVFVYRNGSVTRLRLPEEAPAPAGPIVWIP